MRDLNGCIQMDNSNRIFIYIISRAEIFHPFASFSYIRGNFEYLLHDSDA